MSKLKKEIKRLNSTNLLYHEKAIFNVVLVRSEGNIILVLPVKLMML